MNSSKPTVLIVDDETSVRESFDMILSPHYRVLAAGTGETALKIVAEEKIDLVFLDIRMPGIDGMETLSRLKKISPNLEIIMVTAVQDVQRAARSIKSGARDYLVKPFNVSDIVAITNEVIYKKGLIRSAGVSEEPAKIVGRGDKIERVRRKLSEFAPKKSWVLLIAEDGLEKEKIARLIHYKSKNTLDGFKVLSAAGLADGDLRESQTIFIDHIEKLPRAFQERLAGLDINIRIIAAVPPDFDKSDFPAPLYKKLAENTLVIPPLRDRAGDLVELLEYYRDFFNRVYRQKTGLFSDEAIKTLSLYSWPGNISELKALVSVAVLNQKEGEIVLSSLPLYVLMAVESFKPISFEDIFAEFEKDFIKTVLEKNNSDKQKAAARLGITPLMLESKLQ